MSEPQIPPQPAGTDSVQELHRPHMDIMNDPVMVTADGTQDHDESAPGGQDTVQQMHDILMREPAEPRDGFEPVPMWVPVIFAVLLMWGGYYLGSYNGDFRRDQFDVMTLPALEIPANMPALPDPDPRSVSELIKIGEMKYRSVCMACHKADGRGDPNPSQPYPPLAGSEWVVGAEASPARQVRILLYGLQGPISVKGKTYSGQMPAQGGAMKDYEIAAVLTYIRNSFGHKADTDDANPGVSTALVKTVREKLGKREPFTAAELQKVATDYSDLSDAKKP
jgi:mono/diheme cytochrome c family protein